MCTTGSRNALQVRSMQRLISPDCIQREIVKKINVILVDFILLDICIYILYIYRKGLQLYQHVHNIKLLNLEEVDDLQITTYVERSVLLYVMAVVSRASEGERNWDETDHGPDAGSTRLMEHQRVSRFR